MLRRPTTIACALALFALLGCEEKGAAKPDSSAKDASAALDPTVDPTLGKFGLSDALAGLTRTGTTSTTGTGELRAKIETSLGVMTAKLHEAEAPNTVASFVGLARGVRPFRDVKSGEWVKRPFYDGLTFHRVIREFVIQSGDPLATGKGGPGYKFADEFNEKLRHDKPGVLSMANDGPIDRATNKPGTNGSQFFITEVPAPHLDNHHTVFGELVEGFEVVKKISAVPTNPDKKPLEPVVITKLTVYRQ
jgi:peptidyl-prolyl cis-trans isomerase A (cyclophilin A)